MSKRRSRKPAPGSSPGKARRWRWRRTLLEAVLVLAAFWAIGAWQTRHLLPAARSPAPELKLVDLKGQLVDLADFEQRTVLLHFWATWCGVCRQEFAALNWLQEQLAEDQVLISVVADSEDPNRIRRFVREHDIRYPVLLATEKALRDYRIRSFPTNYYLAAGSSVVDTTVGLSNRLSMHYRLGCAR